MPKRVRDVAQRGIAKAAKLRNSKHRTILVPPELLGAVFLFLPVEDRLSASHVCHHWRGVCLDMASLWADINTKELSLFLSLDLFDRSKGAPLHVTVDTLALDTDIVSAIMRNMDRIVFLDIKSSADILSEILLVPAPRLEELRICDAWLPPGTLDAAIFADGRSWPVLRRLSIENLRLPSYVIMEA